MTAPTIVDYDPLFHADAWLGWTINYKRGCAAVRICTDCPDRAQAEREAARLKCEVEHALCARCASVRHDRIAP